MGNKDWARLEGETGRELFPGWIRDTIGPLFLMFTTPMFIMIVYHTCVQFDGSLVNCFSYMFSNPTWMIPFNGGKSLWLSPLDPEAWRIILSYMAFELVLMRIVPGKEFKATMTSKGHVPVYKANGVQSLFISIITFVALGYYDIIDPTRVYDKFGEIMAAMNLFALAFCFMLAVKGRYFPSTTDCGSTGNLIIDYYWGT